MNIKHEFSKLTYRAFIDDVAINQSGTYQKIIKESGYIILLPLLNSIRLNMNGFSWKIEVNQAFVYYLEKGSIVEIEGELKDNYSCFYSFFLPKIKIPISKVLVPIDFEKENKMQKIIRHDLFNVFI